MEKGILTFKGDIELLQYNGHALSKNSMYKLYNMLNRAIDSATKKMQNKVFLWIMNMVSRGFFQKCRLYRFLNDKYGKKNADYYMKKFEDIYKNKVGNARRITIRSSLFSDRSLNQDLLIIDFNNLFFDFDKIAESFDFTAEQQKNIGNKELGQVPNKGKAGTNLRRRAIETQTSERERKDIAKELRKAKTEEDLMDAFGFDKEDDEFVDLYEYEDGEKQSAGFQMRERSIEELMGEDEFGDEAGSWLSQHDNYALGERVVNDTYLSISRNMLRMPGNIDVPLPDGQISLIKEVRETINKVKDYFKIKSVTSKKGATTYLWGGKKGEREQLDEMEEILGIQNEIWSLIDPTYNTVTIEKDSAGRKFLKKGDSLLSNNKMKRDLIDTLSNTKAKIESNIESLNNRIKNSLSFSRDLQLQSTINDLKDSLVKIDEQVSFLQDFKTLKFDDIVSYIDLRQQRYSMGELAFAKNASLRRIKNKDVLDEIQKAGKEKYDYINKKERDKRGVPNKKEDKDNLEKEVDRLSKIAADQEMVQLSFEYFRTQFEEDKRFFLAATMNPVYELYEEFEKKYYHKIGKTFKGFLNSEAKRVFR